MNREALAWAAGLFDGEGSTLMRRDYRRRRPNLYPDVAINQVDPEVLERFRDAVGVGVVRGPYPNGPRAHRIWHYRAQGFERTIAVVAALWPWLGTIKREQARAVLLEYLAHRKTFNAEWSCGHPRTLVGPTGARLRQCAICLKDRNREWRARQQGARACG